MFNLQCFNCRKNFLWDCGLPHERPNVLRGNLGRLHRNRKGIGKLVPETTDETPESENRTKILENKHRFFQNAEAV